MAGRTSFTSFKVNYDYKPVENDQIELKEGDVCFVQKPFQDPKGWLVGLNSRTNKTGRFPGTFCQILAENTTLPLPPRPPKRNTKGPEKPKFYPINGHMVEKTHFSKPVWCQNCSYFIWGGSRISLRCSSCSLCCHIGCVNYYNLTPCDESKNYHQYEFKKIFKPVHEWSNDDVLEWMVAIHLHPYLNIIKEQQIRGKDLKHVDEQYLKTVGVSIDLHARLFKVSIDELLQPPPDAAAVRAAELFICDNDALATHKNLYEHTFTTFQCCSVCDKPMFGIFRQGLMCAVCGLQCHSSCLYPSLSVCYGQYRHARRLSDSEDPSFCCDFVSPSIPPVMEKCVERVEECGLYTPDIYDAQYPYDSCQALRAAFNQDPKSVIMKEDYWASPLNPAYVLKSFLMELPDPLLDKDLYEDFIKLSESSNWSNNDVTQLLKRQKEHNYFQFGYVISHLWKVASYANANRMTIDRLASIFSVMLVRPQDGQASKFVTNMDAQRNVLMMIFHATKDIIPGMDSMEITEGETLEAEPWLWRNATKAQAQQRLQGLPDGSYLVRESESEKGQWTLAVKERGKERLIRIVKDNGRFGFNKDSIRFRSLKELIEYHQVHPITNRDLIIKLLYPYGNLTGETDEELERLKAEYDEVDQKLKQIKLMEFEKEDKLNLLEECKVLSETQTDIVKFLEDQLVLSKQILEQSMPDDRPDIQGSIDSLNEIIAMEKAQWSELDEQLLSLKQECNFLNTKLHELSPEVSFLEEEYNRLHQRMQDLDKDKAVKSETEDWKGIYDDPSALRNEKRRDMKTAYSSEVIEELSREDWFFEDLNRSAANNMLGNKPSGTFLVRRSNNHPYVISLVYENDVKHVPILQGPNGYGFAEPHNIYKTLEDLINHYHNQSLRMHNNKLDTTLRTPYRLIESKDVEPIYE